MPQPRKSLARRAQKIAPDSLRGFSFALLTHYGRQNWWPAQSRFEVVAGAFLTQNTNWTNVERAMQNLRQARVLSVAGIRNIAVAELERLVRPAGYFRQKAERLKLFVSFLDKNFSGSLARLFSLPVPELRQQLLSLKGVGPETADSIILYAAGRPSFVVDAYTRRILERHGWAQPSMLYDEIKAGFESALRETAWLDTLSGHDPRHPVSRMSALRNDPQSQLYNEVHAVIVRVGNEFCRSKPDCSTCPLRKMLPSAGVTL